MSQMTMAWNHQSQLQITLDLQLLSVEVCTQEENLGDGGSKFVGLNEEELNEVNNSVAKRAYFGKECISS